MKQFKEIFKEWHKEFPVLSKYTDRTLYMRINPFIIGLRFSKHWFGGDDYRLSLEFVPLWEANPKQFGKSTRHRDLEDKKGGQFDIRYGVHDYYFAEALACAKVQFGKVLKDEVLIGDLMESIVETIRPWETKHNPVNWIPVFHLQLALGIYFNKQDFLEEIKGGIEREIKYWTPEELSYWWGIVSIDEWRERIYEPFKDREKFMETIEMNSQRPKVKKLNVGTIVGIDNYHYDSKKSRLDNLRSLFNKR